MSLCTWTCRYRLYFIAAPLALSMSCRPLTRNSQGSSPSPVQSSPVPMLPTIHYYMQPATDASAHPPSPSVATASTSRTTPLSSPLSTSRPLNTQVACSSREPIFLHTAHTPATSSPSCSPSLSGQGSPGTVFCTGAQARLDKPSCSTEPRRPTRTCLPNSFPQRTNLAPKPAFCQHLSSFVALSPLPPVCVSSVARAQSPRFRPTAASQTAPMAPCAPLAPRQTVPGPRVSQTCLCQRPQTQPSTPPATCAASTPCASAPSWCWKRPRRTSSSTLPWTCPSLATSPASSCQ